MFVIVLSEERVVLVVENAFFFSRIFFVETYLSLHSGLKPSGKVRKQSKTASH